MIALVLMCALGTPMQDTGPTNYTILQDTDFNGWSNRELCMLRLDGLIFIIR